MSKNSKIPITKDFFKNIKSAAIYASKGLPKKVWPLLDEYFERNRIEFELTDEQLSRKFDKTMNNIDSITISETVDPRCAGSYCEKDKKIVIDPQKATMRDCTVANTLFHELNHAEDGSIGTKDYTGMVSDYPWTMGIGLNEIVTEMKASRISDNNRIHMHMNESGPERYVVDTFGYSDIIWTGSILHNGLGLGEKEFLKATDNGVAAFNLQMSKRFKNPLDYNYYKDQMDLGIDTIFKILYNGSTKPTQDDVDNLLIQTYNIATTAMRGANEVMVNQITTGDYAKIEDFTQKWRWHLCGIAANEEKGLRTLEVFSTRAGFYPESIRKEEIDFRKAVIKNTQIRILGVEAILGSKIPIDEIEQKELMGKFTSDRALDMSVLEEIYSRCGLELGESLDDMYRAGNNDEKFTDFFKYEYGVDTWENDNLDRYSKNLQKRGSFPDRIRNGVSKIKGKVSALMGKSKLSLAAPTEPLETASKEDQMQLWRNTEDIENDVGAAERYIHLNERLDNEMAQPTIERTTEMLGEITI